MSDYDYWYRKPDTGMEGIIILYGGIPLIVISIVTRLIAILPIRRFQFLKLTDIFLWCLFFISLFRPFDSFLNTLLVDYHGFTILAAMGVLMSIVFFIAAIVLDSQNREKENLL